MDSAGVDFRVQSNDEAPRMSQTVGAALVAALPAAAQRAPPTVAKPFERAGPNKQKPGAVFHPGGIGAIQEFQFPELTDLRNHVKRTTGCARMRRSSQNEQHDLMGNDLFRTSGQNLHLERQPTVHYVSGQRA
jgi:hypothetical protein